MAHLFLSHAVADKALADELKRMIQSAVGIPPTDIFYSSGKGTGIPGGQPFVTYIRDKMQESAFVIALITPAYLESEFCLAELGAVWVSADKDFFPVCVPAVERSKLKATLSGIQVEKIDDLETLVDLSQRLCIHRSQDYNAAAGAEAAKDFLTILPSRLEKLQGATKVSADELLEEQARSLRIGNELTAARDEIGQWEARYRELQDAKNLSEVAELEPSGDVAQQIEQLIVAARQAIDALSKTVRRALPYHLRGEGMPWPDAFSYEHEPVRSEVDNGFLSDGDDGCVYLNTQWPDIKKATSALADLNETLRLLSPDEDRWFVETYGVPADLSQTAAFEALL